MVKVLIRIIKSKLLISIKKRKKENRKKMIMKLSAQILCLVVCLIFSNGQAKILWSDEFDGSTSLSTNWKYDIGGHGWGNHEWQYYTDRSVNSRIENGNLIIDARKEAYGGNQYTSARLLSKRTFKYGILEMRAKLPKGRGTWPAFWLLSAKQPFSWPRNGEIDVMEHVGFEPGVIHGTIHCDKYNWPKNNQKTELKQLLIHFTPTIPIHLTGLVKELGFQLMVNNILSIKEKITHLRVGHLMKSFSLY